MMLHKQKQNGCLERFEDAMQKLDELVKSENAGDENYFTNAHDRYVHSIKRILEFCPIPCTVLDIGSHYLHQSILLKTLGYDVYAIDVPFFAEAKLIRDRATRNSVKLFSVRSLEDDMFLSGLENSFQLVVFTEVLEHITFNPIRLWHRIYDLLTEGGYIYLTTPNSLRPSSIARSLRGIFFFQGIGIPIKDILEGITYGHHWKEYSAWEIKRYFRQLSNDFSTEIRWFDDELYSAPLPKLSKLLNLVPLCRSNIEATIYLKEKHSFCAKPRIPPMIGSAC